MEILTIQDSESEIQKPEFKVRPENVYCITQYVKFLCSLLSLFTTCVFIYSLNESGLNYGSIRFKTGGALQVL
jgi:hypothetical protein